MAIQTVTPRNVPTACSHCKFWSQYDGNNGTCRRHAPVPHVDAGRLVSLFPPMTSDSWCGDWAVNAPLVAEEIQARAAQRKADQELLSKTDLHG